MEESELTQEINEINKGIPFVDAKLLERRIRLDFPILGKII